MVDESGPVSESVLLAQAGKIKSLLGDIGDRTSQLRAVLRPVSLQELSEPPTVDKGSVRVESSAVGTEFDSVYEILLVHRDSLDTIMKYLMV